MFLTHETDAGLFAQVFATQDFQTIKETLSYGEILRLHVHGVVKVFGRRFVALLEDVVTGIHEAQKPEHP